MSQFFKKHPVLIGIIVVIILGILIAVTRNRTKITGVEGTVGSALMPVEGAASSVTRSVGNWFRMILGISDVQRENEQMRQQIIQMESELALLNELQMENARLAEIAKFVEDNKDQYEIVTASVTAKAPGYWFDTFTINLGYRDGIEVDMTVLTPQGLVGRISEVSGSWAKVSSIIDSGNSVSALVERTRDNTVVQGSTQITGDEAYCVMRYLPLDNDLLPADRVLTSGLGGLFPKGIVIGEVTEVDQSTDDMERTALIKPAVDFMKLEEVMIIKHVYAQVSP